MPQGMLCPALWGLHSKASRGWGVVGGQKVKKQQMYSVSDGGQCQGEEMKREWGGSRAGCAKLNNDPPLRRYMCPNTLNLHIWDVTELREFTLIKLSILGCILNYSAEPHVI